jgi:hypothetical protein
MFSGLGIGLFIAGLVFVVLVWVVLRVFPRTNTAMQADVNSFSFPESSKSNDAAIILAPGGRWNILARLPAV